MTDLSIGDVAAQTGVGESTLRMWEHRHGFPAPSRQSGGHRRYTPLDAEAIERVISLREAGLSLTLAIAQAQEPAQTPTSIHAQLRAEHPDLSPQVLSRRKLLALTHAIEDETCARAERPVMFGTFQRERFYRHEEHRWQQFASTAEVACVFADFKRPNSRGPGPIELPIGEQDHLSREWSIICDAPGFGVCLSGWEAPPTARLPAAPRVFETLWSVDPGVVRSAARTCAAIARPSMPELIDRLTDRLGRQVPPPSAAQLKLATAITSRALAYLA